MICWCLVRNIKMADPVGHKKHVKRSTQKDYSAILDHYRKNYVAVSYKLHLIDHLLWNSTQLPFSGSTHLQWGKVWNSEPREKIQKGARIGGTRKATRVRIDWQTWATNGGILYMHPKPFLTHCAHSVEEKTGRRGKGRSRKT